MKLLIPKHQSIPSASVRYFSPPIFRDILGVGKDVPLVESLWDEVKQEEMSLKVSPGISTFADDLNGLEEKLQPLISFALEKVPAEKHAE